MRALLTGIWQSPRLPESQLSMAGYPDELPAICAACPRRITAHLDHIVTQYGKRVEMRPARQRAIQQGGPFTIPGG